MDIHVAHGARFEPVVGISFDENCRSGRHEAVVMYDNLSGSGEQDAAGAVGSPEVAIVNRYVGIPRGVFDKIVFPECFIERLTQGDNKPLAAFPDNAFNAVPGPPRSGRSYNRPDLIIGFEHPFCREPDSEQLNLFPVFRNSDYPGIDAVYVQGIVTLSVAVAAFKFGEKMDDPLAMYMNDIATIPANLAGVPAMSIPAGLSDDGLPVGFQFIAPQQRDEVMYKPAAALEAALEDSWNGPIWNDLKTPWLDGLGK